MTPVTRCSRCKRPLRSGRQIGPRCAAIERAEKKKKAALENVLRIATAPYSARQIEDANKMIAAGKLKPLSRPGLWQATSSDDKRVYVLTAAFCPCRSPGPCYHRCGVAMREAYEAFGEVA